MPLRPQRPLRALRRRSSPLRSPIHRDSARRRSKARRTRGATSQRASTRGLGTRPEWSSVPATRIKLTTPSNRAPRLVQPCLTASLEKSRFFGRQCCDVERRLLRLSPQDLLDVPRGSSISVPKARRDRASGTGPRSITSGGVTSTSTASRSQGESTLESYPHRRANVSGRWSIFAEERRSRRPARCVPRRASPVETSQERRSTMISVVSWWAIQDSNLKPTD